MARCSSPGSTTASRRSRPPRRSDARARAGRPRAAAQRCSACRAGAQGRRCSRPSASDAEHSRTRQRRCRRRSAHDHSGSARAAIDVRLVKETPRRRDAARRSAHTSAGRAISRGPTSRTTRFARAFPACARDRARWHQCVSHRRRRPQVEALVSALGVVRRPAGADPHDRRHAPIAQFVEAIGFPAILVPTVNFDNNQHEENENMRLGNLFEGIVTIAAVLTM